MNDIPKTWEQATVGEICDSIQYGYTASSSDTPCGPRFLRITDIQNGNVNWSTVPYCPIDPADVSKFELHVGDILFARTGGTVGKSFLINAVPEASIFASYLIRLRPSEGISPAFLYYYFQSVSYWEQIGLKKGGLQGNVNATTLSSLRLPVCSLNEQARIVGKIEELFSELDNGIESLQKAREQLKVYRQALLRDAFEGKLTADWRVERKDKLETADQLLDRISGERENCYEQQVRAWKAEVKAWEANGRPGRKPSKPRRPRPLQPCADERLRYLPEGWLWLRYGDLCSIVRNGISQKPEGTFGAKIFRISAVRPMEFVIDDVRHIDNSDGRYDNYFLEPHDIVFTRYNGSRAYVGVCAEYKSDGTHLFPDKLIQTRLAVTSVLPSYVEAGANCGESRKFIERLIRTTAGQSGVSGSDIKAMPIPVCGHAEQEVILERLGRELSEVSRLLDEIHIGLLRAESLRQSILKKAFSGHLVAQNPNDEPASVLLERMRAEKEEGERAAANGRTRRKDAA